MLFFPFRPEVEATLGEDFAYDGSEPRWLCRFIDALACARCGSVDLTVQDLTTYLGCDGPYLPTSPLACPACGSSCHGSLDFDCYGVPGRPLAYLAPKYGAPLSGRLCTACGRVGLSLFPEDAEARRELTARVADHGPCKRCGRGRLRLTRVDVPHAGFGGLFDPALPSGPYKTPTWVADLLVAICDACGEAEARAEWPGPG
jgi:hypothetical protein